MRTDSSNEAVFGAHRKAFSLPGFIAPAAKSDKLKARRLELRYGKANEKNKLAADHSGFRFTAPGGVAAANRFGISHCPERHSGKPPRPIDGRRNFPDQCVPQSPRRVEKISRCARARRRHACLSRHNAVWKAAQRGRSLQ